MALRELRKMRAKGGAERAKANYISTLQHRGKLSTYLSANGYAAYDTDELRFYQKLSKKGRPVTEHIVDIDIPRKEEKEDE